MELTLDTINLFVLFASGLSFLYGMIVFQRNRALPVNRAFFWFAASVGLWSLAMAFFRNPEVSAVVLFAAHALYVAAALIPYTFALFVRTFESKDTLSWKWHLVIGLPCLAMVLLAAIPNLLITGVTFTPGEEPFIVIPIGVHLLYFAYIALYGSGGLAWLFWRFLHARGMLRNKLLYVIVATFVPLSVSLITNLFLPLLGDFSLNWVGQISTFAMLSILMYGMFKHQIFDAKVIATEFLMFVVWGIALTRIAYATSWSEFLFNFIAFVVLLGVGFVLVKSVYREVLAREQIEKLASNLASANERLRELDRQKSEFLSIASHQLRTPLAAVKGYASMLLEETYGPITPEVRKPIESMFTSSSRMADTVEDFLNVSRIEQGKMEYRMKHDDLGILVRSLSADLALAAKEKGLALSYSDDGTGPYTVCMDASKLTHVISNLIDNAIKYTPRGSVTVRLLRDKNMAVVEISDTGAGIPPDAIHTLFDKFVRARNANEVNVTGTGLGLYVARQMVQAHQGTITASSAGEGKGSTFTVRLPLAT